MDGSVNRALTISGLYVWRLPVDRKGKLRFGGSSDIYHFPDFWVSVFKVQEIAGKGIAGELLRVAVIVQRCWNERNKKSHQNRMLVFHKLTTDISIGFFGLRSESVT